jgi:hypothetical protein
MDLLAELKALEANSITQGLPCSAGEAIKSMKEKEREVVQGILDNRTVPITHLLKTLRNNGFDISEASLYKHRRKQCRCFE